jgi:hypothetical protein
MERQYKGYTVHSDGRIEKKDKSGFLVQIKRTDGYMHTCLSFGRKHKPGVRVHTIIWKAFNGEVPKGYEIDHIDNNKENNRLNNLQLLTKAENISKGRRKLSDKKIETVFYLKSLGWIQNDIAKEMGCTQALISYILNGKKYIYTL